MFEVGAVDALIDWIFPHGDGGDLDVGLLAFLIIIMRPLAEGAFVMALVRRYDPFDDDLATRRYHQTHRLGLDDFQRLAEKRAGDFQFHSHAGLLTDRGHV